MPRALNGAALAPGGITGGAGSGVVVVEVEVEVEVDRK